MSKFNLAVLYTVVRVLYSAATKDSTKAVVVSDKVKNDTTIEFKNGSYIKVLASKEEFVRSNRSKIIYPLYNNDGTVDYHFDKEMLDEALAPFAKRKSGVMSYLKHIL